MKSNFQPLKIGPYDSELPGAVIVDLLLDGETITNANFETGYHSKGLERLFSCYTWEKGIILCDHLDAETPFFAEHAYILSIEKLLEIKVDERTELIRTTVSELCRISGHLRYVGKIAKILNLSTLYHFICRDREKILDLLELLTGSRFSNNYVRIGGVSADLTQGFADRVLKVSEELIFRLKEYNELVSFNSNFVERLKGKGILSKLEAKKMGVTGANLRASGEKEDLRLNKSYSCYSAFDFKVPIGSSDVSTVGDCYQRFMIRIREIGESIFILKQAVEKFSMNQKEFVVSSKYKNICSGEALSWVESSRGALGCYIVSSGEESPLTVQFITPSTFALEVCKNILVGEHIENLNLILASFDVSIQEIDK